MSKADRKCPHCGSAVRGHPNKIFCGQRCKDRHHNARNPRGIQAARGGDYREYAETVHPFSAEAFENEF